MGQYEGKVAVITGGGGGIGHGIALACLKEGMKIVLTDLSAPRLEETAAELRKQPGAEIVTAIANVSTEEGIKALAKITMDTYGRVDMLFNNAGVHFHKSFSLLTDNDWNWTIGSNLWSVIYGMRVFIPLIEKNEEGGCIINTASAGGLSGGPSMSHYAATKFGVLGMSQSVLRELRIAKSKVNVMVVMPGKVVSNLLFSEKEIRPDALRNAKEEQTEFDKYMEKDFIVGTSSPAVETDPDNTMTNERCGELIMDGIKAGKNFLMPHEVRKQIAMAMANMYMEGYLDPPAK